MFKAKGCKHVDRSRFGQNKMDPYKSKPLEQHETRIITRRNAFRINYFRD